MNVSDNYKQAQHLGKLLQPIHLDTYKKATNYIDRLSLKRNKIDERITPERVEFKPIKKVMTPQLARVDELRGNQFSYWNEIIKTKK